MEKFTKQLLVSVFFLLALNALATEAHPDYGEAFQQSGHANMTDPVFGFCERLAEITTCVTVTSPKACQRLLDMANPGRKLDLTLPAMMDNAEAGNFANLEQDCDVTRLQFQRLGSVDAMIDGSDREDPSYSLMNDFIDMSYNPGDRADERLGPYYIGHAADAIFVEPEDSQHPLHHQIANNTQKYVEPAPETACHDDSIDPKLLQDPVPTPLPPLKIEESQSSIQALTCQTCKKTFAQKALLQTHIRHQHTISIKPYHCTHLGCNFSAHWPKDLIRHEAVHTQSRLYRCRDCNKSFSSRRQLTATCEVEDA